MSKSKTTSKKKPQKAIITITDEGDGKLDVEMTFRPGVKGDAEMTPAVDLAVRVMEFITEQATKEQAA